MVFKTLDSLNKSQRELLAIITKTDLLTEAMLSTSEFSKTGAADLAEIAATDLISIRKEPDGFHITPVAELQAHFHLEFMELPIARRIAVCTMIAQNYFDRDLVIKGLKVLNDSGDKRLFTDAMLTKTIEVRSSESADEIYLLATQMAQDTFLDKFASASYIVTSLIWKKEYVSALDYLSRLEEEHYKELQETNLITTITLLRAHTHIYMGCAASGTKEILDLMESIKSGKHALSHTAVILACKVLATTALMVQDPKWTSEALGIATEHLRFTDSNYFKYLVIQMEAINYFTEGRLNQAYEKAVTAVYMATTHGYKNLQAPLESLYVLASCEEEFMQKEKALENWEKIVECAERSNLPGWFVVGKVRAARVSAPTSDLSSVVSVIRDMREYANAIPYVNEIDNIIDIDEILVAYRMRNFDRVKVLIARINHYPRIKEISDALQVHMGVRLKTKIFSTQTPREEIMSLLVRAHEPQMPESQLRKLIEQALAVAETNGFRRVVCVQSPHIIAMVLRVASEGKSAYQEHITRTIRSISEARTFATADERISLTDREKEVLALLTAGFDRTTICSQLSLTLNTLKTHQKNLYKKLGVNSRNEAINMAKKLGLATH